MTPIETTKALLILIALLRRDLEAHSLRKLQGAVAAADQRHH
jgi:hypothetical protein